MKLVNIHISSSSTNNYILYRNLDIKARKCLCRIRLNIRTRARTGERTSILQ